MQTPTTIVSLDQKIQVHSTLNDRQRSLAELRERARQDRERILKSDLPLSIRHLLLKSFEAIEQSYLNCEHAIEQLKTTVGCHNGASLVALLNSIDLAHDAMKRPHDNVAV